MNRYMLSQDPTEHRAEAARQARGAYAGGTLVTLYMPGGGSVCVGPRPVGTVGIGACGSTMVTPAVGPIEALTFDRSRFAHAGAIATCQMCHAAMMSTR